MHGNVVLFATRASTILARRVCSLLSLELGSARIRTFSDGEIDVQLQDNVRDSDVYIIAETSPPADKFFEVCFLARAARSSSAHRITLIITYLGYNRQDRKDRPRTQISAEFIAKLLMLSGANRIVLLDLHSEPTQGYFDINRTVVDHLYGSTVAMEYLKQKLSGIPQNELVVASPDKGGGPRAEAYAKRLGLADYVLFTKSRPEANQVAKDHVRIIGDVAGKHVIFVDDMIDTAGTLVADAERAKEAGAKDIYVFATHGLFSGEAVSRLDGSSIKEVITTDTIYHEPRTLRTKNVKITVLSIANLLGQAIRRLNQGQSLSPLIS